MASDSELESDFRADYGGLQPYKFEPRLEEGDSREDSEKEASSSDPELAEAEEEQRMGNTHWCLCKRCDHTWLKQANECLCCHERVKTRALASPTDLGKSV